MNVRQDPRRACACGRKPVHFFRHARVYRCDACAKREGLLVPCTGEAHSNAFIDHCGMCAPRWGWVEADAPPARAEERARVFFVLKNGAGCELAREEADSSYENDEDADYTGQLERWLRKSYTILSPGDTVTLEEVR